MTKNVIQPIIRPESYCLQTKNNILDEYRNKQTFLDKKFFELTSPFPVAPAGSLREAVAYLVTGHHKP